DLRPIEHLQGIEQRDRMKRKSRRVDGNAKLGSARLVQPVDQGRFRVGLPEVDLEPVLLALFDAALFDVVEGVASVDFGFTYAEQVQVGSVEDQDRSSHPNSPSVAPLGEGVISHGYDRKVK